MDVIVSPPSCDEIIVSAVPPTLKAMALSECNKMLKRAAKYSGGRVEASDLAELVLIGKMDMFVALQGTKHIGVVLTEVVEYPRLSALNVAVVSGGDFGKWSKPMLDILEQHARLNGCCMITGTGRRGWMRRLGDWYGDKEVYVTVEKRI